MQTLAEPSGKQRIQSIDILRGAIMLIMALDHTRDFFHNAKGLGEPTDMLTTTPFFFFTRWITHFCAPTFVFLSGVSAYLAGTRRTKGELSAFLIKRGLWLVFVELIVLSFAFSLNPFYNAFVMQVLWAIGCSMILLGLVIRAPLAVIGVLGGLIFFGHDIIDYMQLPKSGPVFILDSIFLNARGTVIPLNNDHILFDLYAILPWTGIMFIGYVFGSLYTPSFDPQRRRKILLYTGLGTLTLFVVLRLINKYGDPEPWGTQRNAVHTLLSFFNVSKYPPSLLYSCMTIGTSLTILSLIEKVQDRFTAILTVYGNVPFFYYILHFYLLRVINVIVFFAMGYGKDQILSRPFLFKPADFAFNLGGVYIVWLVVIIILYFPCRWFSRYKKTHRQWWLSYL